MKVKNINGTAENKCKCDSWLAHWSKFGGGALPTYCPEKSCTNKPEVGAHVQKDTSDMSWYIVPLCKAHNGKLGETVEITDSIKLVSANVADTCGP